MRTKNYLHQCGREHSFEKKGKEKFSVDFFLHLYFNLLADCIYIRFTCIHPRQDRSVVYLTLDLG